MEWVILTLVGMAVGSGLTIFALWLHIQNANERLKRAEDLSVSTRKAADDTARQSSQLRTAKLAFEQSQANWNAEMLSREEKSARAAERRAAELRQHEQAFERRVITYDELVSENGLLKRDLQNLDVTLNKSMLDHDRLSATQANLDERSNDLARRYIKDTQKWAFSSLTVNNYAAVKTRLVDMIERCRSIGFEIPVDQEQETLAALQAEYERIVKAAVEREEQARIKAQIREEGRLQREAQEELDRTARERALIENALADALARTHDEHSVEVEQLKAQLAEAEAKSQRAISMAQQTKAGNVYVISNVGAFGDGVYKVGMTRRLEPKDRIKELGDASVPFPFDIHMMISCDNAPALEYALHRKLHNTRMNKVNPRKEFFRANLDDIVKIVHEHHGEVQYQADAEALEFRQSLSMSDEDAEFIEEAFKEAEVAAGVPDEAE